MITEDKHHEWLNIKKLPTVKNNVHESIYKSYHVLNQVKDMLDRGDSKETVLDFIDFAYTKNDV